MSSSICAMAVAQRPVRPDRPTALRPNSKAREFPANSSIPCCPQSDSAQVTSRSVAPPRERRMYRTGPTARRLRVHSGIHGHPSPCSGTASRKIGEPEQRIHIQWTREPPDCSGRFCGTASLAEWPTASPLRLHLPPPWRPLLHQGRFRCSPEAGPPPRNCSVPLTADRHRTRRLKPCSLPHSVARASSLAWSERSSRRLW